MRASDYFNDYRNWTQRKEQRAANEWKMMRSRREKIAAEIALSFGQSDP
jgi:hypothetical protein